MNVAQEKKSNAVLLLLLLSRFSRVWLCDPIDGSSPGSLVPGILQARTLEWVAISFSNAWKWKVKGKSLSRVLATPWTAAYQAPLSMGFSRQGYWSGVPLPSPRYSCLAHTKIPDSQSNRVSCTNSLGPVCHSSTRQQGEYSWNPSFQTPAKS